MTPQWLAGYFEGRGTIECAASYNVKKRARQDRFSVHVCGTRELVESLQSRFGGKWYSRAAAGRVAPDIRWRAMSSDAARFLAFLQPHVLVRGAEVETALLFYATLRHGKRGSRAVPSEVARRREDLAARLDALRVRRKGYSRSRHRAREMREAIA